MVFPSSVIPCSDKVPDHSGARTKPRFIGGNFPKKETRRLSRKRRKARRRRERNNREVKKMSFVEKGPYDNYWCNYFRCIKWVQSHHASYWKSRVQALEYENMMLRSFLEQTSSYLPGSSGTSLHNQSCKNNTNHVGDESNSSSLHASGLGEGKAEFENDCSVDCSGNVNMIVHSDRDTSDNGSNDEFEFEVDDNMIEFFTQSMKHKLALQRERGEEIDTRAADSYVNNSDTPRFRKKKLRDISQNEIENDSHYDSCVMGLKKVLPTHCIEKNETYEKSDLQDILFKKTEREEKEKQKYELFGKSTSKILGMETAVQLNFTQVCASKRPTLWPIIPLNL